MKIIFEHMSATGNDFLLADNRDKSNLFDQNFYENVFNCLQKNEIDGAILLEPPSCSDSDSDSDSDFRMRYYNRDGGEVELCGNGLRAISWFAFNILNIPTKNNCYEIETMEGQYLSQIMNESDCKIKMSNFLEVNQIDIKDLFPANDSFYMRIGVPHCVYQVENVESVDIFKDSQKIRYDQRFDKGTNINYFQRISDNTLKIRTYERGVEGETLSCGTGVCASSYFAFKKWGNKNWKIETLGGKLTVEIHDNFLFLSGAVKHLGQFSFDKFK